MRRLIVVVDDFLRNPARLLKEAPLRNYRTQSPTYFKSDRSKYAPQISKRIADAAMVDVKFGPESGTYRITTRKEKENLFYVHSDGGANFSGLIYLNPPHECHGGTAFFIHKKTGLEGLHDLDAIYDVLKTLKITFEDLVKRLYRDSQTPSKWVETDFVQMRHNRLIAFQAQIFHSAIFDFKKVKAENRMTFAVYGMAKDKRRKKAI